MTDWKARIGEGLERYSKINETKDEVYLINEPVSVTEPGTNFSPETMNHAEQGIYDAHLMIEAEILNQQRERGVLFAGKTCRRRSGLEVCGHCDRWGNCGVENRNWNKGNLEQGFQERVQTGSVISQRPY